MSDAIISKTPGGAVDEGQQDINDLDILQMQNLRKAFIKELVKNDKPPSDPEDRDFILKLMQQTTQSATANKKIKAEEKAATSNAQTVTNLAETIRATMAAASANNRKEMAQKQRTVPEVEVKTVPGHTSIGTFPVSTTSISNGGTGDMGTSN